MKGSKGNLFGSAMAFLFKKNNRQLSHFEKMIKKTIVVFSNAVIIHIHLKVLNCVEID